MDTLARALGWAALNALWQDCLIGLGVWLFVRQATSAVVRYRATFVGLGSAALLFVSSAALYLRPVPLAPPESVLVAPAARSLLQHDLITPNQVLFWTGIVWLSIALLAAGRCIGGWLWARHVYVQRAVAAAPRMQQLVQRIAGVLRLPSPPVVASALIDSPAVVGVVRPVLVMPAVGLEMLDQRQLDAVVAHELAHIERRDGLASVIQSVIDAVLFFHPVVRYLSRSARAEREFICDTRAVAVCGSAPRYVSALLTLEEARRFGAPTVLAARAGTLVTRARHLLRPAAQPGAPSTVLRACTGACAALVLLSAFVMQPMAQQAVVQLAGTVRYTVSASDPAGNFTVSIERGVAIAATIAQMRIPSRRIIQAGDSVFILNDAGARELALRVASGGGISWSPRPLKSF